jgi:elongation factor P hydroxylase
MKNVIPEQIRGAGCQKATCDNAFHKSQGVAPHLNIPVSNIRGPGATATSTNSRGIRPSNSPARKRTPNLQRIVAHDRRTAAIHEVAHAVVASRWSAHVTIELFAVCLSERPIEIRTVAGQTRCSPTKSKMNESALGWAGHVAVTLALDFDASLEDIVNVLEFEPDTFSATDREAIEQVAPVNRYRTARTAYDLLRTNWPQIMRVTDYLIREHSRHGRARADWDARTGWLGIDKRRGAYLNTTVVPTPR